VLGFVWFRHPHPRWTLDREPAKSLHRHTVRVLLVAVAVMGALLLGGPANAAPAVTSLATDSIGAKATCTTLVTSPASSVAQGAEVTLTAMVTPAAAAGNVQFKDNTKDLGTAVPVTNGTAAMKTTLDAGAHSLTAVFTPTDPAAFSSSTSPPVSLTVTASGQGGTSQATTSQAQQPSQTQQSGQTLDIKPLLEVGGVAVLDGPVRPTSKDKGLVGDLLDDLL
jgi:Bacterial Ig-like domain (group 3)